MESYSRICDYCKRGVDVGEATIDNGMYYHDSCYKATIGKRLKKLDTRMKSGQLSMQEANEMVELKTIINNINESTHHNINLSSKLSIPEKAINAIYSGSACELFGLNNQTKPRLLKDIEIKQIGDGNNGTV